MARVQCKDEAHDGETAWVDREDCLLVRRSVGGAYNRAARMQDSLICLACASRIIAHIEEQGGPRGHRLHNRWSISDLQHAYARFRRSRGLEEAMNPTRDEAEIARLKSLAKGGRDDSEPHMHLALEPGGDPAPRSYDEMPVAHLNPEPGKPNLKPLAEKYFEPTSRAWIDGLTEEEMSEMRAQDEEAKAVVGMIPDTPFSDLVRRYFGPSPMETAFPVVEPKAEPSPEIPEEVRERQARFYEWMTQQGIELTEGQKAAFERRAPIPRLHECEDPECPARELIGRHVAHPKHPTSERVYFPALTEAEKEQAKRRITRRLPDDVTLHHYVVGGSRPRKGRMEVSFPDAQQAPLTEAEERYLARARRQQDELNEQIRAAKEAAWDEGREAEAEAHFADGGYGNVQHPKNPYRKAD